VDSRHKALSWIDPPVGRFMQPSLGGRGVRRRCRRGASRANARRMRRDRATTCARMCCASCGVLKVATADQIQRLPTPHLTYRPSASPPPTSTTARPSSRWSVASRPSAHIAGHGVGGPGSCTVTRDTTTATCGDGSLPAASGIVLPARASSRPGTWAGTAGSWSGPCPGCPAAAACTGAYERKPEHFLAFTAIAATLICHRRLTR
jgi:hypothetical protein